MTKKLFTVLSLLLVVVFVMVGCSGAYKFTPPQTKDSSALTSQNGGAVVSTADYTYFINGAVGNTATNVYGTPIKGAIYRVKNDKLVSAKAVSDFESVKAESIELICPKVVYYTTTVGGLYIFGDRIFFTSPSVTTNSNGVIQTGHTDVISCKLDGTDVVTHLTLKSNTLQMFYTYDSANKATDNGAVSLTYIDKVDEVSRIFNVVLTRKASNKAATPLKYNDKEVEVAGQVYDSVQQKLYVATKQYSDIKDSEDEFYEADYNMILAFDGKGAFTEFTNGKAAEGSKVSYKYTLSQANDGYVYFTVKQINTVGAAGIDIGLFVKYNDKAVTQAANGNLIVADSALVTAFLPYSDHATNRWAVICNLTSGDSIGINVVNQVNGKVNAKLISIDTGATLAFVEGDFVYYTKADSFLYRYKINDTNQAKIAQKVVPYARATTSGATYKIIDGKIFLLNSTAAISGYMFFVAMPTDEITDTKTITRLAVLTEDDIKAEIK